MKKVFGYIRVSTVKQGTHGVSLIEQKSSIEQFAHKNDLTIVRWFEEQETAAKRGRPQFTQMLKMLRRGAASGVVIHKIDRSARNLKDWAEIGDLIDQGINVHFAHESVDMQARGGRLAADIQAVIAADYIRNLRDEVKKGIYGRLKQGLYPFGAPTGYLNTGGGNPKEIDPVKGPLVKEVFKLYSTGKYSITELADVLAERGLAQASGKPLSRNGLSILLKNPFYYGLIRIKKNGQQFAGIHEPLISRELFQDVQDMLSGRCTRKTREHTYLFQRLLSCTDCERSLSGEKQKGHVYYRCHTPACKGVCVREDRLETQWRSLTALLQLDIEQHATLKDYANQLIQNRQSEHKEKRQNAKLQLSRVEKQLNRLLELYLDQKVDETSYQNQQEALLARKLDLERNLQAPESRFVHAVKTTQDFFESVTNILERSLNGDPTQKRALLKHLTSNFSVTGKTVSVELKKPFSFMLNFEDDHECWPRRALHRTCNEKLADQAEKSPQKKKISETDLKKCFKDVMRYCLQSNIQEDVQSP